MNFNSDNYKMATTVQMKVGKYSFKQRAADLFLMLRPKQWTKNLLLFAGLVFSLNLFQLSLVFYAAMAFISFSLLSGGMYILNDIIDIEQDRIHPLKKHRPLAAGKIGGRQIVTMLISLLFLSLLIAWLINIPFFIMSLLYLALVSSYSLWFKHIVILDVFAIAFGFLIRAIAGAVAINVIISPWFLVCTLLLSLFLALTKRRQESVNLSNGTEHRKVLEHYPVQYLDQLISIVTASTIIGYSLYTFTATKSNYFMLTIPFVIYGIFRYLYLVHKKEMGENPVEILFKDKPMIINILFWVFLSIAILYLEQRGVI